MSELEKDDQKSSTEIGRLMFYDQRDPNRDRLSSATFEPFHSVSEYKKRSIRAAKRAIDKIGTGNIKHICIKLRVVRGSVIPIEDIIKAVIKDIPGLNLAYCSF